MRQSSENKVNKLFLDKGTSPPPTTQKKNIYIYIYSLGERQGARKKSRRLKCLVMSYFGGGVI